MQTMSRTASNDKTIDLALARASGSADVFQTFQLPSRKLFALVVSHREHSSASVSSLPDAFAERAMTIPQQIATNSNTVPTNTVRCFMAPMVAPSGAERNCTGVQGG